MFRLSIITDEFILLVIFSLFTLIMSTVYYYSISTILYITVTTTRTFVGIAQVFVRTWNI
jgi:hypothetical protein